MLAHLAALALLAALPPPKLAPGEDADVHHGVAVPDPYRRLEVRSPETQAWSAAQDARARAVLAAMPASRPVRARVREIMSASFPKWFEVEEAGGRLFALLFRPPEQQPKLVLLRSAQDATPERVLVDPNALDPSGETAIDFYVPSHDGAKVAVSLSKGGTEDGTVHVLDVATGARLGGPIPRVNGGTAGGSLAWNGDGTGFWYTRYPASGERSEADLTFFQQVHFHRLGDDPAKDPYELGREFAEPRIAQVKLEAAPDGSAVAARVARGDGGDFEWFLRRGDGPWTRLATFADEIAKGRFGPDGALWLVSRKSAPRGEILKLTAGAAVPARVVPEGAGAIEELEVTRSRVYVVELDGGPTRVRVYDHSGARHPDLPTLPVSTVDRIVRAGDGVLYSNTSFLEPVSWFQASDATGKVSRTALEVRAAVDFSDCEVVRETALSPDGTAVPVSVIQRKGTRRDGKNPTILYGYGGFGISLSPWFSATRRVWLEQGGVYAVANIRGGGELGEAWHRAGMLTRKQNVFDDFTAAARMLVEKGWTSRQRLAIVGGSNGGLLMGAVLTQHPDIARAVVAEVGVFDMLRVELHPNGAHNVTEFGTVADEAQFHALRAYSPYHQVRDGVAYPAVLLTAGENDPRVDSYHAKKMAARLQAATTSRQPILLRVSGGGHGIGSGLDELIARYADLYTFAMDRLGVVWKPPPGPKAPEKR